MSLSWMRADLPGAYAFQVTELPHRAKLDQNEGPVDLPAELKQEIAAELAARAWNRYIQPKEYAAAKQALASMVGLDAEQIAITVGGDQAIESVFLIAGGPGRRARWFEPTYPYIAHAAFRTHTEGGGVSLGLEVDNLALRDVEAAPRTDLVAFVSPNNPTGGMPPEETVLAALADRERCVFVDEAYADFSGHTYAGRLGEHDNLVIGRSLSKASLAAAHVGFVAAHPEAIRKIERMYTAPYQLSWPQLLIALRYPDIAPHVRAGADRIVAERTRVTARLEELADTTPRPSRANFILFSVAGEPDRAVRVHGRLAEKGVRIRDVGSVRGLAGYLRVTLGTTDENELFLDALPDALR